jgi:hypothetical protein
VVGSCKHENEVSISIQREDGEHFGTFEVLLAHQKWSPNGVKSLVALTNAYTRKVSESLSCLTQTNS